MERTVLRSDLREKILTNVELQLNIHRSTGRSVESIKRWCRENSELLTMAPVLNAISSTLKLPSKDVLTEIIDEPKVETSEDSKINTKKALP